ncbi:MAG: hypothetical protein PHI97_19855 [Desulfobulbus sp.]|jgi:hypothetical protein|nr:hypothetical protein [Desulfobulbus sp.]
MQANPHVVLGIHLQDRVKNAPEVQKILTSFGCNIKTRIGLHEVSDDFCSGSGLILLEMVGDTAKYEELANLLNGFDGVEAQKMVFAHD